jgi:hypothetical protein
MVYPNKKSTVNNEESFEQSKEKLENDSLEAKRKEAKKPLYLTRYE